MHMLINICTTLRQNSNYLNLLLGKIIYVHKVHSVPNLSDAQKSLCIQTRHATEKSSTENLSRGTSNRSDWY